MFPTRTMMGPLGQAPPGATFTGRQLSRIRKIPVELVPLFSVVGLGLVCGLAAGGYKLYQDPSIRRRRENIAGKRKAAGKEHH